MRLTALIAVDIVLDSMAATLACRGHEVTRASAARLASRLREGGGFDLVALLQSGDVEADASLCCAVRAAAPEVTLAFAGPLPEQAALAALLDAGVDAHVATSLGAPLFEAQILILERTASERATARRAAELHRGDLFQRLVEIATSFCLRGRFTAEDAIRKHHAGRFVLEWITPGFTELTGFTIEDVNSGYPVRRFIHPADVPIALAWFNRLRVGESATAELRLLTKSGEERWVRSIGQPIRDRSGEAVIGGLGAIKDITAEVRAAEELRHRTAGFEAIVRHAPLAIIAVDYAGNVTRWNPAAERLFGWTEEEALGHPYRVIRPDEWPAFQLGLENAFCGQIEPPGEGERPRKDGSTVTVSAARALLRDAHGAPTGVVMMVADVTQQKQLEAKLRLADRLASVGRLAAAVGHEINNPLTYVLTNMNLVLEQLADRAEGEERSLDAEQIEMLRESRDGAERVRHIVRDLRMFSQGETEERGPVDPRSVLDACVNMTRVELRHRARLVRCYAETPMVFANETRLGQVLLNLIINAADSIVGHDPEENEIRLTTLAAGGGRVTIEVRDTGAGMPKEVLDRIFEPFFTTKAAPHGHGLGLSVCYSLVRAFGGEITVESEVGRGTSFRVHLPAAPAAKASSAAGAASTMETRMSAPKPESMEGTRPRRRLLIVDDEAQVARAIARFLREHDVTIAESGQAALAAIRTQAPFDAILCDLMMPNLTGMDVFEQIRRERPGLEDRVIFMTGGVFTDHAAEFLMKVKNPRLEKPFEPGAVKTAVASMIKR